MEKDKTIIDLISKLKQRINFSLLEPVSYWDADLCAIGLKKGDKLIYISTYNYTREKIARYDYELELIDELNKDNINVLKVGKAVLENDLIFELKAFLGV